jgi:hypothetical protein
MFYPFTYIDDIDYIIWRSCAMVLSKESFSNLWDIDWLINSKALINFKDLVAG